MTPFAGLLLGNHRWPVDSHHKGPLMRKMLWCYEVMMADTLAQLTSGKVAAVWDFQPNSLAPVSHFKTALFNLVLLIGFLRSSNDNASRWMSWDLTDDKSTLVRVMAWCRQATSHYLSQCWPSSTSPYGVTKPQWANVTVPIACTKIRFVISISFLLILRALYMEHSSFCKPKFTHFEKIISARGLVRNNDDVIDIDPA